ncbi:D-aspartate oxidase isoform X1 [Rhipicephalus sanguineus]|uniref:D-aspartate oxidase isoform X1 n=2 Tax=Rhipicephalus sanguineus TaxID=34632 RepID=UPI001893E6BD|nr:D-aspartate oxidase isoform X1 [Rhipicephalus sanguineus]
MMTDHRSQVGTMQHSRVAVIGAGVVGLSTALCIQNNIPGTPVTVIADRFIQDTLSFGAAGFFRPDENIGPTLGITREWFRATFRHYEILLHGNEAETAGIKRLSGYALSSSNQEKLVNGTMKELCVGLRPVDEQELRNFPPKYKYGIFYNSILADPRKYLKWLTDKILCNGGHIKNQSVKDLQDLRDFSVVVNCSGLRAKELAEDPLLTPVRGQVIKVFAPWVTQFYYADGCYILPGTEYVTLGGTKQLGDWNMAVSQHDRDYIWSTCTAVLPSLKDAKVIEDWVGLRPFRQPIRIEAEVLGSGSNQCKVVHNYGHGAHGINTSWGTALHATRLVSDMLQHKMTSALAKL